MGTSYIGVTRNTVKQGIPALVDALRGRSGDLERWLVEPRYRVGLGSSTANNNARIAETCPSRKTKISRSSGSSVS